MKKKITLKYYGHRHPEQLLMRAANTISAVPPTGGLTIRTSTKSATIYADPIQARAIAKQVKKSTGVTVIVNLPDNVGRFIEFLVAEGVFAEWLCNFKYRKKSAPFTPCAFFSEVPIKDWVVSAFFWSSFETGVWILADKRWQNILTTNK